MGRCVYSPFKITPFIYALEGRGFTVLFDKIEEVMILVLSWEITACDYSTSSIILHKI